MSILRVMSVHRILLVEDAQDVQLLVRAALKQKYDLKAVGTAAEARRLLETESFSLVILDVILPDDDGFKVCAFAKLSEKNRSAPVIFLSGQRETSDKVMGLSLGADDYITKPIDPLEFQARVEARLRRVDEMRSLQEHFSLGPFRVAVTQQRISYLDGGCEHILELAAMEFKLLYYLLRHEGQVLSREQILNAVWGEAANVTDRTVDTHIYMIRRKLGPLARHIESVPRQGYRFSQNATASAA